MKIDVIAETKKLNLTRDEYVVFGSGILGALKIREVADVDLLVTPTLFVELQKKGWQYSEVEIEGRMRAKLTHGSAEAFKEFWYGGKDIDVRALIQGAQEIEGVPFLPLDETVKIKKAFNRPVDQKDTALIEAYQKSEKERG